MCMISMDPSGEKTRNIYLGCESKDILEVPYSVPGHFILRAAFVLPRWCDDPHFEIFSVPPLRGLLFCC